MARPSSRARNQVIVQTFRIPEGMTVKELKPEPTEDELDRSHRLWKDKLSFLVTGLPAYILAFLVVFGSMVYSFWVLAHPSMPREDRQFAMSMLMSLGTAVVGFIFGKATK